MKNRYAIATAFFVCICTITTITPRAIFSGGGSQDNNVFNNNVPVTVSPNFSPVFNINMFQDMSANISNSLKAVYEAAHAAYEKSIESLGTLTEWAGNNKLKLTFYTTASVYAYITYRLYTMTHLLAQPDNWSLWNSSSSLEELYAIPEKHLGDILIKEAQQRYTLMDDPENFITPMVTFLHTVEEEKKVLQAYIKLYDWIHAAHLDKLFWLNDNLATAYEERLKRLAYIRAIFVNWITEYKFKHSAVPPHNVVAAA